VPLLLPLFLLESMGVYMNYTDTIVWSDIIKKLGFESREEMMKALKEKCGSDRKCAAFLSEVAGRPISESSFRKLRWRVRDGSDELLTKTCKYCGEEFEVHRAHHRRHPCFKEECVKKHKKKCMDVNNAKARKRVKEKRNDESRGRCTAEGCNAPKGDGLHFLCEKCYAEGGGWEDNLTWTSSWDTRKRHPKHGGEDH